MNLDSRFEQRRSNFIFFHFQTISAPRRLCAGSFFCAGCCDRFWVAKQRRTGPLLHVIEIDAGAQLDEPKSVRRDFDHGEIGVDAVHDGTSRQRKGALLHEFRLAFPGAMLGYDEDRLHAGDQVHGAADCGDGAGLARGPVGEIAILRDLKRAEHAKVQMAAADHGEAVRVMKVRGARQCRHALFARIEQLGIAFAGLGRGAHAEQAIFCVVNQRPARRHELRDQLRNANAQIHIRAVGNVLRQALRHLLARSPDHWRLRHGYDAPASTSSDSWAGLAMATTRSTKMPGVTIDSGSSLPGSTTSATWTIVTLPAIAITGPKFRAVLL